VGAAQEDLASRGQMNISSGTVKQSRTNLLFKLSNLMRKGRLRYIQSGGRAPKTPELGHGNKVP
jgi:hypothetical protein